MLPGLRRNVFVGFPPAGWNGYRARQSGSGRYHEQGSQHYPVLAQVSGGNIADHAFKCTEGKAGQFLRNTGILSESPGRISGDRVGANIEKGPGARSDLNYGIDGIEGCAGGPGGINVSCAGKVLW